MSIFTLARFPKSHFKRIFLAIFALLIAGLLALFITAPNPSTIQKNEPITALSPEEELKRQFKEKLNEDNDGDGLREWEEAVYKTNPENPDTDGDDASDGDEIKQNRNPLVKGPKDRVAPPEKEEVSPLSFKFEKGNTTQEFTQKLMRDPNFLTAMENKGVGISESAINKYINELEINSVINTAKQVPILQLRVTQDENESAIQKYFDSFTDIYIQNYDAFRAVNGSDLVFLLKILETENYKELKKLDLLAVAMENIAANADKLQIPKNILWFHQKMTMLLREGAGELRIMSAMETDPLKAFAAIQKNIKTKEFFDALLAVELKNWLAEKKFTLTKNASFFLLGKSD